MEFAKKLIIWVLIFCGLFCIISTAAWFLLGDWPREIAEFFMWPIMGVISYNLKSGYENGEKIKK